ncbi:MAG: hypothetical protein ACP6IU_13860 [Candidatus Asgardarchaeia archaeon]
MPKGIAVVKWDDRIGTKIITKYPSDLSVSPTLTMRVYGGHVLGERRESNFISMKVDQLNIASFFSGIEINKFIMLLLDEGEQAETFQEPLKLIGSELLALPDREIVKMLPSVYDKILAYLQFTNRQRLALLLSMSDRLRVIDLLEEETFARLSDIQKLTKKPVEFVLEPLKDQEIIEKKWIEGEEDEIVFLKKHIWIGRVPPKNAPAAVHDAIRLFFEKYVITRKEELTVIHSLVDVNTEPLFNLLEKSPYSIKELEAITGMDEDTLVNTLEDLETKRFVKHIGDKYYLISKPVIILIPAKDVARHIIQLYNSGSISKMVALHILTELRNDIARELGVM